MLATFRTEMTKQWRRPRTYVVLSLTVIVPIVVALALKLNPPTQVPHDQQDAFFFLATKTGLILPVAALQVMSQFLLVIVVALFAGEAVASESSWGNLRAILTRPIGRSRLLGAKLASASLLALIATVLIPLIGLIAGTIAFGWHPLDVLGFHQSTTQIVGNLSLGAGYVFWGLSSVVAFAFMVSTMTDSPAGAVFAGFGLYIVSRILDGISALGSIRNVLPTHYLSAWTDLFTKNGASTDMLRGVLLPIGYVLVFCTIAWWSFRRKDILS